MNVKYIFYVILKYNMSKPIHISYSIYYITNNICIVHLLFNFIEKIVLLFFPTKSLYILSILLYYVLHVFCVNYYFFVFGTKRVVKKCAISLKNHPTTFLQPITR